MTVSTNNGRVNGPVHNLLMQLFTLGSSKIDVFETWFFHIVTTQNDHPSYAKHVLGRIYVFFTLFGYQVGGGGSLADVALFPTQKVTCTFSSQTFCERRLGPFRLLTSFFSPSCDLHVLPVVLISSQPTHT